MTVATTSSRMTEAEALLALSNQSETDADEGIVSDQSSASSTASSSDLILQQDSSKTIKVREGLTDRKKEIIGHPIHFLRPLFCHGVTKARFGDLTNVLAERNSQPI